MLLIKILNLSIHIIREINKIFGRNWSKKITKKIIYSP